MAQQGSSSMDSEAAREMAKFERAELDHLVDSLLRLRRQLEAAESKREPVLLNVRAPPCSGPAAAAGSSAPEDPLRLGLRVQGLGLSPSSFRRSCRCSERTRAWTQ